MLLFALFTVFQAEVCFGYYGNYYGSNNVEFYDRQRDAEPKSPSYYHNKHSTTSQSWIQQVQLWILNRKVSFQNRKMLEMRQVIGELVNMNDGFTPIDGGFGPWTDWSSCSRICGGGVHTRSRQCNKPFPANGGKNCVGNFVETKACVNGFCKDSSGIAQVQSLVLQSIELFQKTIWSWGSSGSSSSSSSTSSSSITTTTTTTTIVSSSTYYKSLFIIQQIIAREFLSITTITSVTVIRIRLQKLETSFFAAASAGSLIYARTTLARCIYTYFQLKITEHVAITQVTTQTTEYLLYLRTTVGNRTMSQILSSNGDTTLMFVVDTTGSVISNKGYIQSIIQQITSASNKRSFNVDYILAPFSLSTVGSITYRTSSQGTSFVNDIMGLTPPRGYYGRPFLYSLYYKRPIDTCKEVGFQGMLNAIYTATNPPKFGSPMFVFTDALPSDGTAAKIAQLKKAVEQFDIRINFFNHVSTCSGSRQSYEEIASVTSGHMFLMSAITELPKFTDYITSGLTEETLIASGGFINSSRLHLFSIESSIAKLFVSAKVSVANMAQHVSLMSPNGSYINLQKLPWYKRTLTSLTIRFEVTPPQAGTWNLTFPSSSGDYEFNVKAVCNKSIEFSYYFVDDLMNVNNGNSVPMPSPFKGIHSSLIVQIGGIEHIDVSSLTIDILNTNGKEMQSGLSLRSTHASGVYNVTFPPTNTTFKIRLAGMTQIGENFERASVTIDTVPAFLLSLESGGNGISAKIGGTPIDIKFQLLSRDVDQQYLITSHISLGQINFSSFYMGTSTYGYNHTIRYTPPASGAHYHGKIARLTLSGTGSVTGAAIAQTVEILLLK